MRVGPRNGPCASVTHTTLAALLVLAVVAGLSYIYTWKREVVMDSIKLIYPAKKTVRDGVTVVTAYFKLGSFQKGEGHSVFTPNLYKQWMSVFQFIDNPMYIYVDTQEYFDHFQKLREGKKNTKIVMIIRQDLWSFKIKANISRIFSQPNYPKHHPNTVVPEYSCAMHAKYEVMQKAVTENAFMTKYFAWLDVGLFRDIAQRRDVIHIHFPPRFDPSRVSYTEVNAKRSNIGAEKIMKYNQVWVCGCFFIAQRDVMATWTAEYLHATHAYIKQGLMNTDQQVIYSMFQENSPVKRTTQIQTYKGDGRYNNWFHLGYVCKE